VAENTFIQIEGIEGEATEENHAGWVPLKSIEWGMERTVDMTDLTTKQRGYANTNFEKVSLTSDLSKASAKICTYVASGKITKEVVIHLCRSGDDAGKGMEPYLIIKLGNCMIDSYSVSGGEESLPEETWSLAYRNIVIEYKEADFKTGKLTKADEFKWNLEKGNVSTG
jgi:type VI secretion system secreted protein Hcp